MSGRAWKHSSEAPPATKRMRDTESTVEEERRKSPSSLRVATSHMETQGPGVFSCSPLRGAALNPGHGRSVGNGPVEQQNIPWEHRPAAGAAGLPLLLRPQLSPSSPFRICLIYMPLKPAEPGGVNRP